MTNDAPAVRSRLRTPVDRALDAPETTGIFQYVVWDYIQIHEQTGFDLVLIDCPPNLYRCTWTVMIDSGFASAPVPPEDFGAQVSRF